MRILILGGTRFIGPHQVQCAVQRGHEVTVFNRGRQLTGLPVAVQWLRGDRNGKLDALKDGRWDVCIDNSATLPSWVEATGDLLNDRVGRYVFLSSMAVYVDFSTAGIDETSEVARYVGTDPHADLLMDLDRHYGALKVLSEQAAERCFPQRTTILRPGLVVGPGDVFDRFTYWALRIREGGSVLLPGSPDDPIQFIDARDLAEYTITLCEKPQSGVFNVTGPAQVLTMRDFVDGISRACGPIREVIFEWLPWQFLLQRGIAPWTELPMCAITDENTPGWHRASVAKAISRGLRFRSLASTVVDTLAWWDSLPSARREHLRAGLSSSKEATVLAEWRRSSIATQLEL